LNQAIALNRNGLNRMSVEDLRALVRARPGLIIGPSWCYGKDTFAELSQRLSPRDPPQHDVPYFEAITDSIRQGNGSQAQAEGVIRSFFSRPVLERSHKAAKIRWSVDLSNRSGLSFPTS